MPREQDFDPVFYHPFLIGGQIDVFINLPEKQAIGMAIEKCGGTAHEEAYRDAHHQGKAREMIGVPSY